MSDGLQVSGALVPVHVEHISDIFSARKRDRFDCSVPVGAPLADAVPGHLLRDGFRYYVRGLGQVDACGLRETPTTGGGASIVIVSNVGNPADAFNAIMSLVVSSIADVATRALGQMMSQTLWDFFKALGAKAPSYSGDELAESPTYGWDGVQTTTNVDVPVPVVYGQAMVGGNIVNAFIDVEAEVNAANVAIRETSYLYVLLALAEGPVSAVCGIEADTDDADTDAIGEALFIEDNPVSNYDDVTVAVRLGTNNQTAIPGFQRIHRLRDLAQELVYNEPYTIRTEGDDIKAVRITFRMDGLYRISSSGTSGATQRILIEYKLASASEWTEWGEWKIIAKRVSAFRQSVEIELPAAGEYDIRLTKKMIDSTTSYVTRATLVTLDEIRDGDQSYPNTALLGLKIKATGQLNGTLSKINALVRGAAVKNWNADTEEWQVSYSSNPIWCLRDVLTNAVWGLGKKIDEADIDDARFKEEAAYCDELVSGSPRYSLGLVIDAKSNPSDILAHFTSCCAAALVWSSRAAFPFIDRPGYPVQHFGYGNIKQGSLSVAYPSRRQTYNAVTVQFSNADLDYKRDSVRAVDSEAIAAGDPEREKTVFVPAIQSIAQAERIATHLVLSERYTKRVISFETALEGIFCQPGDIVEVAHPILGWGRGSGRLSGGTTTSITLPVSLTIGDGETIYVRVRHNSDGSMETRAISEVAGTYAAGTALDVAEAFDMAPAAFDVYSIGASVTELDNDDSVVGRLFRVTALSRKDGGTVEITASEYDERVYDPSGVTTEPPDSDVPDPLRIPRHAPAIAASNNADAFTPGIVVEWEHSPDYGNPGSGAGIVSRYEVYQATDGATFDLVATVETDTWIKTSDIVPGETYSFRVLPVSIVGRKPLLSGAETASVMAAAGALPPNVTGLELFGQAHDTEFVGRDPKFVWRVAALDTNPDPFGTLTELGAGAGAVGSTFQDYRVEVWSGGAVRRVEHVTRAEFTYSYEMNVADHAGVPVRTLELRAYARDIFNQLSSVPAKLTVSNPRPERPANVTVFPTFRGGTVKWDEVSDLDLAGYIVWEGAGSSFTPSDENRIYKGRNSSVGVAVDQGATKYYRVAAYDAFGEYSLDYTDAYAVTPLALDGGEIPDGTIGANHIIAGSIDTLQLAAGAITADKIAAGVVSADKLAVGQRGILLDGIFFRQSESVPDRLTWTAGTVHYVNSDAVATETNVDAGTYDWVTGDVYVYWTQGATTLSTTTTRSTAFTGDNVPLAIYRGGTDITALANQTLIDGAHIATGTIDADRMNVSQLSAIAANLGTVTSGTITLDLGSSQLLRIDSSGLYVSQDNGSTWRAVLSVQGGQVKLSFDSFGTGDELPGLEASIAETETVTVWSPSSTATSSVSGSTPVHDVRERLTFNVTATRAAGEDSATFTVAIYDASDVLLWSQTFDNTDEDVSESHTAPRIHLTGVDVGLDVGDRYKLGQIVNDGLGSSIMQTTVTATRAVTVVSANVPQTLASASWTSPDFQLSTPDQFEVFDLEAYRVSAESGASLRVRLYDGNDNLMATWTDGTMTNDSWTSATLDFPNVYPEAEGVSLGESYYYVIDWTSGTSSRFRGTIESSKILTGIIRKT